MWQLKQFHNLFAKFGKYILLQVNPSAMEGITGEGGGGGRVQYVDEQYENIKIQIDLKLSCMPPKLWEPW